MILFIGDEPVKGNTIPFKDAKCWPRLQEWIKQVGAPGDSIKIVNRVSKYFDAFVIWAHQDGYPIIALGNKASDALMTIPHFKLPHPSGLNRQINDKEFIKKQLNACKSYINKAKLGKSRQF